jgi:hypothetical protein
MCTGGGGGNDKKPIPSSYLKIENNILEGLSAEGLKADYSQYDTLTIPANIISISTNAFSNVTTNLSFVQNLEYINYENDCHLMNVDSNAFLGLTNLQVAEFPLTLNTLGVSCFESDVNFCMLIIHSTHVVNYSTNLLTGTLFNTQEELNQGMVVVETNDLADDYRNASGWNQFPKDAFQSNEETNER